MSSRFHFEHEGEVHAVQVEKIGEGWRVIRGSGDAAVHVLEVLDVSISGSGDVYYKGHPIVNSHISGSGDVIDAN